jgi:hypothetical protein
MFVRSFRVRRWPVLVTSAAVAFAMLPAAVPAPADPDGVSGQPVTAAPGAGPERITGPIPQRARPGDPAHAYTFYATPFDLRRAGYVEQEFFIAGTATRYPANPTADEQKQAANPIGTVPYTTRIVVRRPAHPGRSAGVAVVDWQNVTSGHDLDTEWGTSGDYFVRHGWTYVGASVQRVGVNGAPPGPTAGLGLRDWSPARYGSLDLTGGGTVLDDTQSFDVYTQVAKLLKGRDRQNPLADLRISKVYAGGASQSGRFLGVYYNTVQPIEHVYDGFLLALSDAALPPRPQVATKAIRVYTENDVYRGAAVPSKLAPDGETLRTWHIAGASHVPAYATSSDPADFRATLGAVQEREFGPAPALDCVNPGPSEVFSWTAFHAAYEALDDWVRRGVPPRRAQPLAIIDPASPAKIVRDGNGIAVGGIRLPDVEVPVALNDGINGPANLNNPLSGFCVLWGTHRDFGQEQLDALYYDDADYRDQVADVVRRLEGQRFLLPEDSHVFLEAARHRHV